MLRHRTQHATGNSSPDLKKLRAPEETIMTVHYSICRNDFPNCYIFVSYPTDGTAEWKASSLRIYPAQDYLSADLEWLKKTRRIILVWDDDRFIKYAPPLPWNPSTLFGSWGANRYEIWWCRSWIERKCCWLNNKAVLRNITYLLKYRKWTKLDLYPTSYQK